MNCTRGQTIRFALFAGAAVSTATSNAYAQDEGTAELDKYPVTGSRISQTNIETPNPMFVVIREISTGPAWSVSARS